MIQGAAKDHHDTVDKAVVATLHMWLQGLTRWKMKKMQTSGEPREYFQLKISHVARVLFECTAGQWPLLARSGVADGCQCRLVMS